MLTVISALLTPPTCSGCGLPGPEWCAGCAGISPAPAWIDVGLRTQVLFSFAGPVRRTIIDWKEEGRRAPRQRVVKWMAAGLGPLLAEFPEALLVPIPSSPRSERIRGARVLLDALRAVVPPDRLADALVPVRSRHDQAGLSREQRAANLEGAMRWLGPPDQPLIIVDDIVTSGATLREAARAVRAAAAIPICGFALARR